MRRKPYEQELLEIEAAQYRAKLAAAEALAAALEKAENAMAVILDTDGEFGQSALGAARATLRELSAVLRQYREVEVMNDTEKFIYAAMSDFADAQTTAKQRICVESVAGRLTAAEALAEVLDKIKQLIINDDVAYITMQKMDDMFPEIDDALRQYREAGNG